MKKEITSKEASRTLRINPYAYAIFMLLVVYLLVRGDMENAVINMGIALIFDPFNPNLKWQDRPLYQKAWLMAHLTLTLAGFIYLVLR
jgi:formate/nitrite transporter FocA (FNT family)